MRFIAKLKAKVIWHASTNKRWSWHKVTSQYSNWHRGGSEVPPKYFHYVHVPIMSMDNGKMHILPVHVCSHNVIFDSPKYHKILGDLTFWRKPGNLDKKRTRTYLWGRYSSQGRRYRTAAFGFTPCPILSCPWRMDGGPLVLMAIDLVDAWSWSIRPSQDKRTWVVHRLMAEKSAWSHPSSSIGQIGPSIHLHLGPLHPWHQGVRFWSMMGSLDTSRRMDVEASVLVGKLVDGWPMAKSLLKHFGGHRGVGTRSLAPDSSLNGWLCDARHSPCRGLMDVGLGVFKAGLLGHGRLWARLWAVSHAATSVAPRWRTLPPPAVGHILWPWNGSYLVDPASSHMLVSKIKPCMSKYKQIVRRNCEWLIKSVIVYLMVPYYLDNRGNSRANTC